MTSDELQEELKNWLIASNLPFRGDDETWTVRIEGVSGHWEAGLACRKEVHSFAVVIALPIRVPEERRSRTAAFLHHLNFNMRFGAFLLAQSSGQIFFRLAWPLVEGNSLSDQFDQAMNHACATVDANLHPIAAFITDTEEVRRRIAEIEKDLGGPSGELSLNNRLDFS
jgi:hypothetical protein